MYLHLHLGLSLSTFPREKCAISVYLMPMHLAMRRRRRRQHAISFQSHAPTRLLCPFSSCFHCCCHILLLPLFTAHLLRHKLLLLQLKITLQQLLHLLMTTLAPKVVSTALGALTDELLIRKCFSLATLRFPLATVAVAVPTTDASSEKRANKASLSTTDKLAEATRTLNILCSA